MIQSQSISENDSTSFSVPLKNKSKEATKEDLQEGSAAVMARLAEVRKKLAKPNKFLPTV
ncbi:hypothetical protein KIN20_001162 [Parelaphostrongylus tenuis]|uniref:Uncharacterized protein n=1 Tax=Parelaphostrongylus tenuis TaxID=148309 RepID=A0AAD5LWL3_PARTN|nr:hypothetical protein KIN20_001162 [Parelaphostrongylus tenuis]